MKKGRGPSFRFVFFACFMSGLERIYSTVLVQFGAELVP